MFVRQPIQIKSEPRNGGWREWTGVINGNEWVSCLHADRQGVLWIGTSVGRVLTRRGEEWGVEVELEPQVTGVAVESTNRVWLSTGDGIRLLDRQGNNQWRVTPFRTYYQGAPGLVSGGYGAGFDAERLWGYVDGVYVPPLKKSHYAPFVISAEHGLFSWGGYHGVWHHFLPHYWGANSEWLDTRTLIPHRRPTCMIEDGAGNLWVGTEGDGLVRFNAPARDYCERAPEHNQKDFTEFAFFAARDLRCEFTAVQALAPSADPRSVWSLLTGSDRRSHIALFDGQQWSTLPLAHKANCVREIAARVALVGLNSGHFELARVDIAEKTVERVEPPGTQGYITHIVDAANGRFFCASRLALFEKEEGLR